MQTKFEHFAVTSMMADEDYPPRQNGSLKFDRFWEERAFGIAIALAKKGHYEWEDFRQELINSIAQWEESHSKNDPNWDYYGRWLLALERLAIESELIKEEELEQRTYEMMVQEQNSTSEA